MEGDDGVGADEARGEVRVVVWGGGERGYGERGEIGVGEREGGCVCEGRGREGER